MEKRIVTFFMLMVCAIGAMAQQYSVQCQVNDSNGEGIPFATIYIYNNSRMIEIGGGYVRIKIN